MEKSNLNSAKRNTIQRKLILDVLVKMKGLHPSALEVHGELKKEYPGISTATVYSHLRGFSEEGKLRVLSCLGAADRFDLVLKEHYHIKCKFCGKLSDLLMEVQSELNSEAAKLSGYTVHGHNIIFHGICPDCKGEQKSCHTSKKS